MNSRYYASRADRLINLVLDGSDVCVATRAILGETDKDLCNVCFRAPPDKLEGGLVPICSGCARDRAGVVHYQLKLAQIQQDLASRSRDD